MTLPRYEDMLFNVSLILGNSYEPLSAPVRFPKNYKEIGGYHIETHAAPLPEVCPVTLHYLRFYF